MWQLDASGALTLAPDLSALPVIDPAAPLSVRAGDAVIRFGGQADGRGFSTARRLRAAGLTATLYADGPLIPDQARHAFQSGFDVVLIDAERLARHGHDGWANALQDAVPTLYAAQAGTRGHETSLWQQRHGQ
ncbi:MAG: DUF934 domain-containing protein [Pseudomonadota bacterium]